MSGVPAQAADGRARRPAYTWTAVLIALSCGGASAALGRQSPAGFQPSRLMTTTIATMNVT